MQQPPSPRNLRGVNLAGAEFGFERAGRGTFGVDYIYPSPSYVPGYNSPTYFAQHGMDVFRLPFRWERLQPTRNAAFDPAELERLRTTVSQLRALGATVILDVHNYARYDGMLIGSSGVPNSDFADLWRRLAKLYAGDAGVVFGLMNEPHDMATGQWVDAANAAIAAIRATGSGNLILVAGNGWSGAHSWAGDAYGTPNAVAMLEIRDSADNLAFEAHQYLDWDSSGKTSDCVYPATAVERLQPFTNWLLTHDQRGFLGEFGAGDSRVCLVSLASMLDHVEANDEVYLGWTYWAAGPWWKEDFMSIEPVDGRDKPQMIVLDRYLSR